MVKSGEYETEEINEEIYEEGSSYYESAHKQTTYEDVESFHARPSTQRDTTGKLQYIDHSENDIPEAQTTEEKASAIDSQIMRNTNREMEQVFQQIEYTYVDQSIKQKKWINRSVMQKRDEMR